MGTQEAGSGRGTHGNPGIFHWDPGSLDSMGTQELRSGFHGDCWGVARVGKGGNSKATKHILLLFLVVTASKAAIRPAVPRPVPVYGLWI